MYIAGIYLVYIYLVDDTIELPDGNYVFGRHSHPSKYQYVLVRTGTYSLSYTYWHTLGHNALPCTVIDFPND